MGLNDVNEREVPPESAPDVEENAELVLFQVKECYVYLIPPRKSAASYRADEWDINKWNWEGALRVVSKGEECFIRLEDKSTGELYAQAIVRQDEPLPLEAVIDSSRFFVLRIEDTTSNSKQKRHANIGLGLRERPQAYDFQAAIFDHVKYLNKKKEAEEIVQEYQSKPSVDYSLKEGETLRLQINTTRGKRASAGYVPSVCAVYLSAGRVYLYFRAPQQIQANKMSSGSSLKSGRTLDVSSLQDTLPESQLIRQVSGGSGVPILVPPPPPPSSPLSGVSAPALKVSHSSRTTDARKIDTTAENDGPDEDFGEFQAA